MPPLETARTSAQKNLYIGVGVLVVAALIAYFLFANKASAPPSDEAAERADTLSRAAEDIARPPAVSPSVNPAREAVPGVNPLEKTNPFNNAYANPFE